MVLCGVKTVKNANSHLSKPELDSRCLVFEYNKRIGYLLSLLPFCQKNTVVYLINQKYEVFCLGKARFLVFYTGMILSRYLR